MTTPDYQQMRAQLLQRRIAGELGEAEYRGLLADLNAAEAEEAHRQREADAKAKAQWERMPVYDGRDEEGPTAPFHITPGYRVGKYILRETIGTGGMGIVWVAEDTENQREVALKILPEKFQKMPAELARFRQTFHLVQSKLHHENICPLFDLGEHKHPSVGWYQVMRLIRGRDIGEFFRAHVASRKGFSKKLLGELLGPVASALDYAHSQKVVHRDLKPENILVEGDGEDVKRVWLIDFGVAAEIRSTMTRVEGLNVADTAGSRGYLAPELLQGRYPDARSDQYALGVVAYELLAGRLPFNAEDYLVLRQAVLDQPVEPIRGLPEWMMGAVSKALSKKPAERFANCTEFVEALVTKPVAAKPMEPPKTTAPGEGRDVSPPIPSPVTPQPVEPPKTVEPATENAKPRSVAEILAEARDRAKSRVIPPSSGPRNRPLDQMHLEDRRQLFQALTSLCQRQRLLKLYNFWDYVRRYLTAISLVPVAAFVAFMLFLAAGDFSSMALRRSEDSMDADEKADDVSDKEEDDGRFGSRSYYRRQASNDRETAREFSLQAAYCRIAGLFFVLVAGSVVIYVVIGFRKRLRRKEALVDRLTSECRELSTQYSAELSQLDLSDHNALRTTCLDLASDELLEYAGYVSQQYFAAFLAVFLGWLGLHHYVHRHSALGGQRLGLALLFPLTFLAALLGAWEGIMILRASHKDYYDKCILGEGIWQFGRREKDPTAIPA